MPRFACPGCKHSLSVSEGERGMVVTCPTCRQKIRVPLKKPAGVSGAVKAGAPKRPVHEEEESQRPLKKKAAAPENIEEEELVDEDEESRRPAKKRAEEDDAKKKRRPVDDFNEDDFDEEDEGTHRTKRRQGGLLVMISGVIGSLGAVLFLALFVLIISGRGPRWLMDFIQEKLEQNGIPPLLAIGITAGVFLIPVGLWILVSTKSAILGAMPDELDFRPARMSKFPDLDTDELQRLTEAFEELGFEQAMDYTVVTELENFPKGFARLFVNTGDKCYAEINQGFTAAGDAVPMRCMIATHFDDSWSLQTGNRAASKENYLMRRPRAVWRSLPNQDPDNLMAHHLKMRKKMVKTLEIEPVEELSTKAYFAREKIANRERKQVVRRRWSVGILLEFFFFDKNPKYEWLGEYAAAAE